MTTASSELLPGYRVDPETGAWCTLPWPTDPEEKLAIVRSSLAPALIAWAEGRTERPGLIHYLTGQPWRFTDGQKRFLMLWYWVDDDGRFVYRRGVKRGAKGTGKDPFAATIGNMELAGPVELYDVDDKTGRPIGRPRGLPLVQISSNSESQSRDLLRIMNAMWSMDARAFYRLDCGVTRTVMVDSFGRVEVNTLSEKTNEGDPVTCSLLNETHHMHTDQGHAIAAQARRNVAKSPASVQARSLEFTNAHRLGQESVAEKSYEAWQVQQAPKYSNPRDILYDSIEAPPTADMMTEEGRLAGLRAAYMDAKWSDLLRMSREMLDNTTSVGDSIRYYFNGLAADEDSWVDPANFDQLADASNPLQAGQQIALFLDCSKSEDATALVGCRLRDFYVQQLGCWAKPKGWNDKRDGRWLVPRDQVDDAVRAAKATYKVEWFGVDPGPAKDDEGVALYWADQIAEWATLFRPRLKVWATPGAKGSPVLYDMRLSASGGLARNYEFTKTAELVQSWIDDEGPDEVPFRWDGSPQLRSHVHAAKNRPNQWGISLGKVTRDSLQLVDLAVAMVGAVVGARAVIASGKVKIRTGARSGGGWRAVVPS
ncbi:hypothetical protein ATK74_0821 [Propionicimonas paludicola]|uniref:Phage terminase large subunit-like protein n=1 Tax=Propionicimonas paludicola TaxID=185243 RepID=A0A2A9CPA0_9ACTN|nr:terminase [Propionicimonas paludicola]PFG16287.1 hypothetical protein ATK74_0821 [Propionicimonas paludicola]